MTAETKAVAVKEEKLDPALANALVIVERAKSFAIKTREDVALAQEFGKEIAKAYKAAEAVTQPPVDIAHKAWKDQVAHRDKYLPPLDAAKKLMAAKVGDYLAEEARKAEEARRAAEAKAREEALARQKAEAEAKAREAEILDKAGLKEDAAAAMEQAVEIEQATVPEVYVPPVETSKAKDVALGEDWCFEIQDETKIPREYLSVDTVKIGKVVRALKKAASIPGVRVYSKPRVSFRAGA